MSPEQAEGQPLDERSDVFSFGCMLFEAVTNQLPFWHESAATALHRLMHEPPPRLAATVGERSVELQSLIDKCLAKDVDQRWRSIAEVNLRLRALPEAQAPHDTVSVAPRWWIWAAAIVAILATGAGAWQWRAAPLPEASVAVIPFARGDLNEQDAFLTDGLSEGLVNALAQLPDIKVIARTSSSRVSPVDLDVRQAARTLGARTMVIGRVGHVDGRLKVSVELVNGVDGTAMWASDYFPDRDNLVDVEGDLAREIARRVRSKLTAADERRLAKTLSRSAEAYGLLLRGRYQMWLYSPESTQKAAALFEQALGLDPDFALAHAELANTYRRLGGAGILDPAQAIPNAEKAARRAVSGDADMAEAHTVLADIHRDRWQWDAAEREYRQAIELSASNVPAHQGLALLLSLRGSADDAVAEVTRARELDPIGLSTAIDAAAVFYNLRRYDRALETLRAAVNLDSTSPALWTWIGIVNGGKGQFGDALIALERAMSMGDATAATQCYYVHALAKVGRQAEAMQRLEAILKGHAFVPRSVAGDRLRGHRPPRSGHRSARSRLCRPGSAAAVRRRRVPPRRAAARLALSTVDGTNRAAAVAGRRCRGRLKAAPTTLRLKEEHRVVVVAPDDARAVFRDRHRPAHLDRGVAPELGACLVEQIEDPGDIIGIPVGGGDSCSASIDARAVRQVVQRMPPVLLQDSAVARQLDQASVRRAGAVVVVHHRGDERGVIGDRHRADIVMSGRIERGESSQRPRRRRTE